MYFVHPSVLVCISSSQSDSFEVRAFLYALLFLRVSRRTSRLHHGWLKCVDVYLEGTYLLTLSMHFCLKVVQSVLTSVSVVLACVNSCVNSFKSSDIEDLSARFHR